MISVSALRPQLVAGVVLACLAACSPGAQASIPSASRTSIAPSSVSHALVGELRLKSNWFGNSPCCGSSLEERDEETKALFIGAGVRILDEEGTTLGSTLLRGGEIVEDEDPNDLQPKDCILSFEVPELATASSYTFMVRHYEGVTYSFAELDRSNWHVELMAGLECQPSVICGAN